MTYVCICTYIYIYVYEDINYHLIVWFSWFAPSFKAKVLPEIDPQLTQVIRIKGPDRKAKSSSNADPLSIFLLVDG